MIVTKHILGEGAGQYLPFAMAKLKILAERGKFPATAHYFEDAGAVIKVEVFNEKRGAVTVRGGLRYMIGGFVADPSTYEIYGATGLTDGFRKVAALSLVSATASTAGLSGALPSYTGTATVNDPIFDANQDVTTQEYDIPPSGGAVKKTLLVLYRIPASAVSAAFLVGSLYIGVTGVGKGIRRINVTHESDSNGSNAAYRAFASISDDNGVTYRAKFSITNNGAIVGTNENVIIVERLGNQTLLAFVLTTPNNHGLASTYIYPDPPYMMRSTDGGATWVKVLLPNVFFYASQYAYAGSTINMTQIQNSYNTFANNSELLALGGGKVVLIGAQAGYYADYSFSHPAPVYVHHSTDNGLTFDAGVKLADILYWVEPLGYGAIAAVVQPDQTINGYSVVISVDGGVTWSYNLLPPDFSLSTRVPGISLLAKPVVSKSGIVDPSTLQLAVVLPIADGTWLYVTRDGCATWKKTARIADPSTGDFMALLPLSSSGSIPFPTLYTNSGTPL